jgi:homoserine kinase type II
MAVFTRVERAELEGFLSDYRVGVLVGYAGIQGGTANTNYFVTTTDGEYVLTLFEGLASHELPFFLELTAHLAEHGIPCAHPVVDGAGKYLKTLHDKPAALVMRLGGIAVEHARPPHCAAVGDLLARMHRAAESLTITRENPFGPAWRSETAARVAERLPREDAALLAAEMAFQAEHVSAALARGIIHADLFRDNVLFSEGDLSGVIDFYFACEEDLLFDVAVAVNDWCSLDDGGLDPARVTALLAAYHGHRNLTDEERDAWPGMLRAAALRFWLSRLQDYYFPRPGVITLTKEPEEFRRILTARIDAGESLVECWP